MSGPECCQNPQAISSGRESGELLQIGSLNSYVSGNPDSKVAVLLVSDVQLADKVAAAGYYAVVPDFFHGDPLTSINKLGDWRKNHAREQAVEFAKPVIQALKEKGITKIGAAGFFWGAKVVVQLAKDAEIQFAALLHPSFVTLDDIKDIKVLPFVSILYSFRWLRQTPAARFQPLQQRSQRWFYKLKDGGQIQ
ncbi:putative dienelactone hydrolase, alpha/Beta hydrolase [Helianthus anomalus]